MSSVKAVEGQWYTDRATHDLFCVIAVDDIDGLIDVRDDYGDIDEFDFDEWEAMDLVLCAAPQQPVSRDEPEGEETTGSEGSPPQDLRHRR